MDDAYPSGSSAGRDAVVNPPPSSPGDSVSDGEAESRWPYLFRAGLNPDTLLDDGPQLHELPEGPSVGLCLELDAARQSLGAPRSILLVWLARLFGAKWPEPEPQPDAVTFVLKKVKASASSLRKEQRTSRRKRTSATFLGPTLYTAKHKQQKKEKSHNPRPSEPARATPDMVLRSGYQVDIQELNHELEKMQEKLAESYSNVRNLTKKIRRRDVELDRRAEELHRAEVDKTNPEQACKEYQYEVPAT